MYKEAIIKDAVYIVFGGNVFWYNILNFRDMCWFQALFNLWL